MKKLSMVGVVFILAAQVRPVFAQPHYQLGANWVKGTGVFVVVDETDYFGTNLLGNRVLVLANIDGTTDPLHAWINQDFGPDYMVKCDVRMDTFYNGADTTTADLCRAGIAARIQPKGTSGSDTQDRGINLLFHENLDTIEYLNDFVQWANTDDNGYTWLVGTWYTFELTITGQTATGKVYLRETGPDGDDVITLKPYTFTGRPTGFAGITGCNVQGYVASFDNFEVIVNGTSVFQDDFEGELERAPQTVGLKSDWMSGEGGYWIVNDGVLYGIGTSRLDPKKIWYNSEITGGASIKADIRMLSWHNDIDTTHANDYSRSGVALHIQPGGRGGGRAPDETRGPGEARGMNMLFHDNVDTVEFLDDFAAWANLDDNIVPWEVGAWYTFEFTSDGTTVSGTFTPKDNPGQAFQMTPWTDRPIPANRANGFAGLAASTVPGEMAAYDNVEIRDGSGNVIFTDTFDAVVRVEDWPLH
ncbi:MAG: hypothetical protein ACE15F_05395 [bacterium]